MDYQKFLKDVSCKADKLMLHYFDNVEHEYKEDCSIVTKADKEINRMVIEEVQQHYPEHNVYGEEESHRHSDSDYLWVCDPIDGTSMFANAIPTAVFSLALVKDGEPIAAVISHPFSDLKVCAEKGKGCFAGEERMKVDDGQKLAGGKLGVTVWKHGTAYYEEGAVERLLDAHGKVYDLGSIAYMALLVAMGKFRACVFPGCHAHDVAAAALLITESGGKASDVYGKDQRYDDAIKGFLGSNGLIHEALVKVYGAQNKQN